MKFNATFMREFKVEIDAPTIEIAEQLAKKVVTEFPVDTCKLMTIYPEGYVEPADPPTQTSPPHKPFNKPNGGGTPGTPVVKTEVLVDQIAKVA